MQAPMTANDPDWCAAKGENAGKGDSQRHRTVDDPVRVSDSVGWPFRTGDLQAARRAAAGFAMPVVQCSRVAKKRMSG